MHSRNLKPPTKTQILIAFWNFKIKNPTTKPQNPKTPKPRVKFKFEFIWYNKLKLIQIDHLIVLHSIEGGSSNRIWSDKNPVLTTYKKFQMRSLTCSTRRWHRTLLRTSKRAKTSQIGSSQTPIQSTSQSKIKNRKLPNQSILMWLRHPILAQKKGSNQKVTLIWI